MRNLLNPIKSVTPYSTILLLNVYLDTSSISTKASNPSDLKYSVFLGLHFFVKLVHYDPN